MKMKNIKAILLIVLFSFALNTTMFADSGVEERETLKDSATDIQNSFGYFDIGLGPAPIPLPIFGIGYRSQINHHGVGFSLNTSTIVAVTQVKGNVLYHYYFKPNLKSQFYAGGGLGVGSLFGRKERTVFSLSPEFVFGKEYQTETNDRRFFQLQISWPTFGIDPRHNREFRHSTFYFPLVVFSYGIGF
jgi:hypothetical protein